jgi:divalent metal cation (Fe/Co/Zn/Cd) transporter
MWVEVHMLLPGAKTIQDGHANVTRIEDDIRALFPTYSVYITTHIEPDAHDEAHPGGHGGRADPIGHSEAPSD